MNLRFARAAGVAAALVGTSFLTACVTEEAADHEMPAAGAERTPFPFTGTVERVDATARSVTVRNDDVPGWMGSMSMTYAVDRPEVIDQLTTGARVRATVYGGDFTTLYGLELIPQ